MPTTPYRTGYFPAAGNARQSSLPDPMLSSRSRNWDGIVVELRRGRDVDIEIPYREHVVAVILAGGASLYQSRNGRTSLRTLRSGDVILTPAGEPKRWQHAEEAVAIALRLSPSYVARVAEWRATRGKNTQLQDNFGTRDPYIEEAALRLLKALEREDGAGRTYVESLTSQLATHLIRHYSVCAKPALVLERRAATLSRHKLSRAIEYVESHLSDDLTLHEMAAALALSPGHFAHAFRATVGVPPHQYVLRRRVERAKALLRNSDLPITQIAEQIGSSSPSSFSFLFHRVTGVSPRTYRSGKARPSSEISGPIGVNGASRLAYLAGDIAANDRQVPPADSPRAGKPGW
jgi:AraC family transcriptional regulator